MCSGRGGSAHSGVQCAVQPFTGVLKSVEDEVRKLARIKTTLWSRFNLTEIAARAEAA
jgi:hypothetical protein